MATSQSTSTPSTPYEDHVLGAADVCSNCLRLIRVERIDPTRSGLGGEYESSLERNPQTTEVGYGPSEAVSDAKGTFCACGVESARHREWSNDDVDRERFETLLKHLLATLEHKDITHKRRETAAYALQRFKDDAGVDAALATGLEAGIVAAAAGG